jgi:transcriptional regulator with XRE-family HTH domain
MGLFSSDFSEVFSKLLGETGVSCYRIADYTGLDPAYLSRLKNGERSNPSPETVVRIGLALAHESKKVKQHDIERLLNSVGQSLFRNRARSSPYD